MAEALSKIRSANPFGKDDPPNSPSPSHSPSRDTATRVRLHAKYVSNNIDDTRARALRILSANGHVPETSAISNADDTTASQLPASVDPLSRYIIQRTGAPVTSPVGTLGARRLSEHALSPVNTADRVLSKTSGENVRDYEVDANSKERKKGVSFRTLRRLIVNKKEDPYEEPGLDKYEGVDERPEGAEAEVFQQPIDNIGYSPRHLQPPAYIKVRSSGKKDKDFNRLFVAQELQAETPQLLVRQGSNMSQNRLRRNRPQTGEATWAMEFSMDGRYLATAGQDRIVRIWGVLSSPEERTRHEKDEETFENTAGQKVHLSAPVFRKTPIRTYEGHTASILALTWSKNNFVLSSSMDKTVRLWHVSRPECLCAFKHHDYVTSIQFHPRDDRFFLAGSLDMKLRLWSIPDKSVAFWNQLPEMITSVAFTPDGKTAIAGCLSGLCLFYDTEGLRYQTQMHVRSTHGKNSKGSKITGIQAINIPPSDPNGDVKLLITSNDSRVRMYNLRDKSLEAKFKGNENSSSQIHARFSDDAKYIVCGSEDARVFIWHVRNPDFDRRSKARVEAFEAHNAATTVSLFAPTRTRQLLSNSEDPLYDLCNPPPVTLLSKAERDSMHSSRAASEKDKAYSPTGSIHRRHEENPTYIARCNHTDGSIIVTGDAAGVIKVFRQDCAYEKRIAWDTGSANSAKRFGIGAALVGRSRQSSNATQPPGERILSWRQEVMRKDSTTSSIHGNGSGISVATTWPKIGGPADSPGRPINRVPSTHSSQVENGFQPKDNPSPNMPQQSFARTNTQPAKLPHPTLVSPPTIIAPSGQRLDSSTTPPAQHSEHNHEAAPARTNSNEYWEHSAWHDDMLQQLQQPPRKRGHADGDREPASAMTGSRSSAEGLIDPAHPSGQISRSVSPNGLLGLSPLVRGASVASRLTDELSSVEPSDAEDNVQNRGSRDDRADQGRGRPDRGKAEGAHRDR